jgi:hypothetical protein
MSACAHAVLPSSSQNDRVEGYPDNGTNSRARKKLYLGNARAPFQLFDDNHSDLRCDY